MVVINVSRRLLNLPRRRFVFEIYIHLLSMYPTLNKVGRCRLGIVSRRVASNMTV